MLSLFETFFFAELILLFSVLGWHFERFRFELVEVFTNTQIGNNGNIHIRELYHMKTKNPAKCYPMNIEPGTSAIWI